MPAITLRLTEEQHEVVRGWAFVNKRSIQRELEARLFDGVLDGRDGTPVETPLPAGARDGSTPSTGASRPSSTQAAASAHCARAFAHHNYHSGKPCPHCGYPE